VLRSGLESMRVRRLLRADAPVEMLATTLLTAHQGGSLLAQVMRDITPLRHALDSALQYVFSFAVDPAKLPVQRLHHRGVRSRI
jgi:TetR/AcrR family transcriptional regulator, transcriptional repressor for nem operon